MVKINLNIKKKDLWLLAAVMVFVVGVGYVIAWSYVNPILNPGHGGDNIFVYINAGSKELQQAIADGNFNSTLNKLPPSIPSFVSGSYSGNIVQGHKGEEIIVNVGDNIKSFQQANSDGSLCKVIPGTSPSNFGSITYGHTGDKILINIKGSEKTLQQAINDGDFSGCIIIRPISTGKYSSCVLKTNGNVFCWGSDLSGQAQPYLGGDAVSVVSGVSHNCVLKKNGNVFCWGWNGWGQANPYNGGDAVDIWAGSVNTCALKSNGNVQCWGDNTYGVNAGYSGGDVIKLMSSESDLDHVCVVKSNGNVGCWGKNSYLGTFHGNVITYNGGDAVSVAGSWEHTSILKSNGTIQSWGARNLYGEVIQYNTGDAVEITGSIGGICALKSNGNVQCWGQNNAGSLDPYSGSDGRYINVASNHRCVLKNNRNVDCHGSSANNGKNADYSGGDAVIPG